jgi:hypothetical protein
VPIEFRLRFPLSEVMFWAARYSYADDAEVEAVGRGAAKRGWYTRDEFLTVTRWKTQRSRSRCEANDEASVEATTRLALSTPDERIRIEAFTRLHGVAYPTASVLLHFARPDLYPIIDFRALWSLGWDSAPSSYTFEFWWGYTLACRSLAKNAGVTVRTLDRALWQYSKERQVRASRRSPALRASETEQDIGDVAHKADPTRSTAHVQVSPRTPTERTPMSGTRRYPYRADVHARLIETAMNGGTITYSGLGTGRRMVGSYLYRIAKEEQAARRPPLTALVVHKTDGKPGPGFLEAAKWVGFWREGETEDGVWRRAVEAVHEYWRPKLTDDLE